MAVGNAGGQTQLQYIFVLSYSLHLIPFSKNNAGLRNAGKKSLLEAHQNNAYIVRHTHAATHARTDTHAPPPQHTRTRFHPQILC